MEEPKWRLTERLAAILEKALTPSAHVRHNIRLPVLGRPEREPRQCDIVIVSGQEPRQTISIVEVQDRSRRPDLTIFHGWITKMQEVGAQHLICVSALGYPESIINDVAQRFGPTVRLMTLKELEEGDIPPLVLPPVVIHRSPSIYYESLGPLQLENGLYLTGKIKYDDPIFSLDDEKERYSLNNLVTKVLANDVPLYFAWDGLVEPPEYPVTLTIGADRRTVWLLSHDRRYRILRFDVRVKVTMRLTEIPLSLLSYRQEFYDGTLAWLAIARGEVEGKIAETNLVFMPDEEGFLRVSSVQTEGTDSLTLVSFNNKNDFDAAMALYRK